MDSLQEYYKNSLMDNLCDEYKQLWRGCGNNDERLVGLALQQQSLPHMMHYSYIGKGLTKDYVKDRFYGYINGRRTIKDCDGIQGYTYQIWVDYNGIVCVDCDVLAFMYCKETTLVIPKTKCPTIYVGCKTKLNILCNGNNTFRVYAFDESQVLIDDMDVESSATVFKYSSKVAVEKNEYCLGVVKEFDKELRL